jgi:hypothetical protein
MRRQDILGRKYLFQAIGQAGWHCGQVVLCRQHQPTSGFRFFHHDKNHARGRDEGQAAGDGVNGFGL